MNAIHVEGIDRRLGMQRHVVSEVNGWVEDPPFSLYVVVLGLYRAPEVKVGDAGEETKHLESNKSSTTRDIFNMSCHLETTSLNPGFQYGSQPFLCLRQRVQHCFHDGFDVDHNCHYQPIYSAAL